MYLCYEEPEKIQNKVSWTTEIHTIQNIVKKVKITGVLKDGKPESQHWVFTEERLDEIEVVMNIHLIS